MFYKEIAFISCILEKKIILILYKILILFKTILTLLSERFLYRSWAYWHFSYFFFFRKILVPFTCFYLKIFFVFFLNNNHLLFWYIRKKLKNIFLGFLIFHFFIRIFSLETFFKIIFLTTHDQEEKYAKMMQSNSSDNCVHHSHTEISNFFDPKLRVNNTKAMIKNNLKALLSELKNFSQY